MKQNTWACVSAAAGAALFILAQQATAAERPLVPGMPHVTYGPSVAFYPQRGVQTYVVDQGPQSGSPGSGVYPDSDVRDGYGALPFVVYGLPRMIVGFPRAFYKRVAYHHHVHADPRPAKVWGRPMLRPRMVGYAGGGYRMHRGPAHRVGGPRMMRPVAARPMGGARPPVSR